MLLWTRRPQGEHHGVCVVGRRARSDAQREATLWDIYRGPFAACRLVARMRRDPHRDGSHGRVLEAGLEHSRWSVCRGAARERAAHQSGPGSEDDQKDSEWIADLLQHGLLRGSFVPPQPTRELRDLTRYRVSLSQECNGIANRIQKVLEDANLKLSSVATDALGASGRAMLRAIIAGEEDVATLANMAKGLLRNKIPALREALAGRVTEHHRFMLREFLDDLDHAEAKMTTVEQEIDRRLRPFQDDVTRLCTIPGVDRVTAWGVLSEIGFNMDQFPSAAHLASWAGMCPGNAESAGKRLSGKTRKGSAFLRRHLCQAGWAVSTKKNTYSLSALSPGRQASRSQARDDGRRPCHSGGRLSFAQAEDDVPSISGPTISIVAMPTPSVDRW